jgi:ABC-type glycerol-3-phosphate transport system substrate-binding protein
VLAGAAGAAAATVLGGAGRGCAGPDGRTQVAVVWSGHELAMFRRSLRGYPDPVEVISVGDDIDALIRARQRGGTSPDVAILPRPGLVRGYVERGWLAPMRPHIRARFPTTWNALLRLHGEVYGAWVKAAVQSLFWYLPSLVDDRPATWDELVTQVRRRAGGSSGAGGGSAAPLAVGAADGWTLTTWLNNMLALTVPPGSAVDEELAAGEPRWHDPAAREAFAQLARVWSAPGAFPGGGSRALVTQFDASVVQVTSGEAAMTCGGDFVASFADRFPPEPPDRGLGWFRFPGAPGGGPMVVGGDAAVVLHDSPAGHDLVEWLTRRGAFRPWLESGGYLTPSDSVQIGNYPEGRTRELARDIRRPQVRFGLTDRLPGTVNGRDGFGSWLVMQDFFAEVSAPSPDVEAAIDRAADRLNAAVVAAREDLADA